MNRNIAKNRVQPEDIVDEIIELAKLDEKIDKLSMSIVGIVENDRQSMPASVFNRYKDIVVASFEPSEMKKDIRLILAEQYDGEIFCNIITFLHRSEIEILTQLENAPMTPERMSEMQRFFNELQVAPPAQERKLLIEQLDEVKKSSATFIDSQLELFRTITWGMRGLNEDESKVTDSKLNELVLDMKNRATPEMERNVWMGMLFTLRSRSNNELEKTITLYKTTEGELTIKIMKTIFHRMYGRMTRRLQCSLETEFVV